MKHRRRLLSTCVAVAVPLACAHSSGGYPPPCGPSVTRADCYQGTLAELRCEPDQWLADSLARSRDVLAECSEDRGSYQGRTSGQTAAAPSELETFWRRANLFSIEGVSSARVGRCCTPGAPSECLRVELQRCRTPPHEVLQKIQALANTDPTVRGKNFGVSLSVLGFRRPRCTRDDPSCSPLAYDEQSPPSYDAEASRHVFPDIPERILEGECAHDGDCFKTGCGNWCSSWIWRNYAGTCEGHPALSDSFCGCVAGRCRWFEQ